MVLAEQCQWFITEAQRKMIIKFLIQNHQKWDDGGPFNPVY